MVNVFEGLYGIPAYLKTLLVILLSVNIVTNKYCILVITF